MGVFDTLRERYRDRTREDICAGLQSLGVRARMAARGREEEGPAEPLLHLGGVTWGGTGSLGIIDIDDGPISWVNVHKVDEWGGTPGRFPGASPFFKAHYTDYGVNVTYRPPDTTIMTVKKRFLSLGKVVDADWRAFGSDKDSALVAELLRRLREDAQVRATVIATRGDVSITGSGSFGWIVSTQDGKVPTRQVWDGYQAIARHLIEAGRGQPDAA